jgi:predicted RNA-binding protein with PUA-like domain
MNFWLLKTEPRVYSFDDLLRDRRTNWDGVRNFQARNNLNAVRVGDLALIYHSGDAREVVGLARITRAAFPDPTSDDSRWLAVEVEPVARLRRAVALGAVRTVPSLRDMALVRQPRLSVAPVRPAEFREVLSLADSSDLLPSL